MEIKLGHLLWLWIEETETSCEKMFGSLWHSDGKNDKMDFSCKSLMGTVNGQPTKVPFTHILYTALPVTHDSYPAGTAVKGYLWLMVLPTDWRSRGSTHQPLGLWSTLSTERTCFSVVTCHGVWITIRPPVESRGVPGLDSFWWQDPRNPVLQGRDEEPIIDETIRVILCLDTKAKTNTLISENKHNSYCTLVRGEERACGEPCSGKLDSP